LLEVIRSHGDDTLARVYVARLGGDDTRCVEFVESLQPPRTRREKQVIIVSTLLGCPFGCSICDAGGHYQGRLSADEILAQIEHVVDRHFPERPIDTDMLKVQLARVGEPSLNPAVIEALEAMPGRFPTRNLVVSVSTIAPRACEPFFEKLREVKDRHYADGRFQLQFSIHCTDWEKRRQLVPAATLDMAQMARLGEDWWRHGDRKVTLNFAPAAGYPVDAAEVARHFDPERFLVKLTPVNPTESQAASGLETLIDPHRPESADDLLRSFRELGFDTLLSIGEVEENAIGSNCGMYLGREREKRYRERAAQK